jgi:hypothetical protein
MRNAFLLPAAFALVVGACASGRTDTSSRSYSEVITEEELLDIGELSAYEAVRRLRPRWLSLRGPLTTMNPGARQGIRVYVDGGFRGGVDELKSLQASDVGSMRFLDAREATTRYGTDHADGAIVVRTRRD